MKAVPSTPPGNFLERIVARAHGDGEMAAPRVPGLFEPVRRAAVPGDGEDTRLEAHRQAHPDPAATDNRKLTDRLDAVRQRDEAAALRAPSEPAQEPVRRRAGDPVAVRDHDWNALAIVAPQERRPPSSTDAGTGESRAATAARVRADVAVLAHDAALAARLAQPPRQSTAHDSAPEHSPREPRREAARTNAVVDAPPPAVAALVPQRLPPDFDAQRFASAKHRDVGERAAPAAPEVHISIGRVEIRAHVAPAKTVTGRESPAARPTRLDAYLNRRGRAQ